MKAMVLAAGLGTRLGKVTESIPKCLVEVNGKTLLEYVVDNLKRAGVNQIIINLHHLHEMVRKFVADKNSFGIKVELSYEPEILGTGGGLKKVRDFFATSEPFIVHNADVYSDINLRELVAYHKKEHALVTLAVMNRNTDRALVFDGDGVLVGWENKKENQRDIIKSGDNDIPLGFSGIQVASPLLFQFMKAEEGKFSIIRAYMNAARAGEKVKAFRMDDAYWIDAGTPERLEQLRQKLIQDR